MCLLPSGLDDTEGETVIQAIKRALAPKRISALEHQSHVAPLKPRQIRGGNIKLPTKELVYVWSSVLSGAVRPYDVRTWLAAREAYEQRKFASRGIVPAYKLSELTRLVGGGGGGARPIRASIGRLQRAGLMTWGPKGPCFASSAAFLTAETLPYVQKMEPLMPPKRAFFPMPRPVLRLLAGGVKVSVVATVFAHLLRCPHLKSAGWDSTGTVKANWIESAFGISERSAVRARSHLIHELGWLTSVPSPVWHQKKYGGSFAVNLEWTSETPALIAEQRHEARAEFSTAVLSDQNGQNDTRLSDLESEQLSPTEIQESDLGVRTPEPSNDFWTQKDGNTEAPNLRKVIKEDLPCVARVMELFEQALSDPRWKARGWTPTDGYLDRLNWAAAARRVYIRGGTNPPGLFVHLVSNRLWSHISNDDEDAVRRDLACWLNPEPTPVASGGGGAATKRKPPKLDPDAKVLRCVEVALRRHGVDASPQRVNRELAQRGGWASERIAEARRTFEAWKEGGAPKGGLSLRAFEDDEF